MKRNRARSDATLTGLLLGFLLVWLTAPSARALDFSSLLPSYVETFDGETGSPTTPEIDLDLIGDGGGLALLNGEYDPVGSPLPSAAVRRSFRSRTRFLASTSRPSAFGCFGTSVTESIGIRGYYEGFSVAPGEGIGIAGLRALYDGGTETTFAYVIGSINGCCGNAASGSWSSLAPSACSARTP